MFHSLPGPWLELCTFKFSVHPAFWEGKRGLEKGIDVVKIQPLYLLQKTAEGIEGGAGRGFSKPSPLHRTKPGLPGGRNYAGAGPPPPPREFPPACSGRWDRHGAWGPPRSVGTARAGDWLGPPAAHQLSKLRHRAPGSASRLTSQ